MAKGPKAPKETPAERTQADIGIDQYKLSQKTTKMRGDLDRRIADYRQEKQTLANRSAVDTAIVGAATKRPVASTSPGAAMEAGLRRGQGTAAQAESTRERGDTAQVAAQQGLASLSVGEQGQAIEGMGTLARRGLDEAVTRARSDAASSRATGEAVAGLAGAVGAGLYGQKREPALPGLDLPIDPPQR